MQQPRVRVRDAVPADADFLAELWSGELRRAEHREQVADLVAVVESARRSCDQRLAIAERAGEPVGAVLLRLGSVGPLNPEPVVQVLSPHVVPGRRRRGVGRLLMETALAFAEERGVPQVATAVEAGARDSNRFMARLALGPQATVRLGPTAAVRARLSAQRPQPATTGSRQSATRLLAARRSMRGSRSPG